MVYDLVSLLLYRVPLYSVLDIQILHLLRFQFDRPKHYEYSVQLSQGVSDENIATITGLVTVSLVSVWTTVVPLFTFLPFINFRRPALLVVSRSFRSRYRSGHHAQGPRPSNPGPVSFMH